MIIVVKVAGADLGFENREGAGGVIGVLAWSAGAQTGHSQAKNRGGGACAPCAPPGSAPEVGNCFCLTTFGMSSPLPRMLFGSRFWMLPGHCSMGIWDSDDHGTLPYTWTWWPEHVPAVLASLYKFMPMLRPAHQEIYLGPRHHVCFRLCWSRYLDPSLAAPYRRSRILLVPRHHPCS